MGSGGGSRGVAFARASADYYGAIIKILYRSIRPATLRSADGVLEVRLGAPTK